MTARVAADYSSTSVWTVRRNVQACGRRGRALVYCIDDIERWMRGMSLAPTAGAPMIAPPRQMATTAADSLARIRDLGRPIADALRAASLAEDADSLAP